MYLLGWYTLVHYLSPAVVTSHCNLILQAALDWMSKGHMLADVVAIIGKHM